MPKARQRKVPVTDKRPSAKTANGPALIRRFHVLLKRKELLANQGTSSTSQELFDIEQEIESLGGVETYQRMSVRGQSEERGGGTEKVFVAWLKDLGGHNRQDNRLLRY